MSRFLDSIECRDRLRRIERDLIEIALIALPCLHDIGIVGFERATNVHHVAKPNEVIHPIDRREFSSKRIGLHEVDALGVDIAVEQVRAEGIFERLERTGRRGIFGQVVRELVVDLHQRDAKRAGNTQQERRRQYPFRVIEGRTEELVDHMTHNPPLCALLIG